MWTNIHEILIRIESEIYSFFKHLLDKFLMPSRWIIEEKEQRNMLPN